MKIAITRRIGPALDRSELSFLPRCQIDLRLAMAQHRAYEQVLESRGCEIRALPAEPGLPDSVFVEDAAVVLDDVAVITHPGALSRRAETGSIAAVLCEYRQLLYIAAPATLDGGDVLRIGRTLHVGLSARSNRAGIEQLAALLGRYDFKVEAVPMNGCLHLKSAVTQVTPELLLINPGWVDPRQFPDMRVIDVDPAEPHAANALMVDNAVIYPESWPLTRARLNDHGVETIVIDMSETEKAEGGVTCCSLIFEE